MTYYEKVLAAWNKKLAGWFNKNPRPKPPAAVTPLPTLLQRPSPNYSTRTAKIDLVVVHDTEGAYGSAVNWLCTPTKYDSKGHVISGPDASAHVVLREDGKEATQLVRWSKKAWACEAFNSRSLNLEMAGKASVGYGSAEIDAAARIVAYWCKLYGIPVRNALGGKQSGITFHQDLGTAGGGHHDPGWSANQKAAFIALVKTHSGKAFKPAPWGLT